MARHIALSTFVLLVVCQSSLFGPAYGGTVDLTSDNRRPPIPGLPDWSGVGFERGARDLPTDADVGKIITADELASTYGVIPDDGQDDTDALQNAVSAAPGSEGSYTLIQLPAGVINLSHTIYLDGSYVILRGFSNDPDTGTRLVFSPDENTKYDVLSSDGSQWDLDGMSFSWQYDAQQDDPSGDPPPGSSCGTFSTCDVVKGSATSGWLWPGRSIFRVGTREIANKFNVPHDMAPDNRKDFFLGSVNFHWSIDQGKTKGFLVDQSSPKAGVKGTNRVYVANTTDFGYYEEASEVWIGSPVKYNDYKAWGVEHDDYYVNSYVFQDWFGIVDRGSDDRGAYLDLDHDLRFDLYANSVSDGSPVMDNTVSYGKVMPLHPVSHIGIENLYMTQPMPGFEPSDAVNNYGNMAPESAMHGIVFRVAENCWVRNIRTFMTGSHPIATEDARNIQIQDNYFDGAWNKGAGGNGYLRGSRVWESLYYNNTLRNLRHITMQWSSMGNVVLLNNMTNDMNMHGGYEGYNLFELNYVSVPYEHRAGSCTANCGGEGGSTEGGTWWPIYWSTGDKASKWSGATGPQNVFYRNYMLKAPTPGSAQVEYRPYFARDGSLSDIVWQFGWDRDTAQGDHYQHLSEGPLSGPGVLLDWQGHEQEDFSQDPNLGVNGMQTDQYTSLFLRDVSNSTGIPSFSSIAGYAYCRGSVIPKVVGYYLTSSDSSTCVSTSTDEVDVSSYTHVIMAYANLGSDGTVTLSSDQQGKANSLVGSSADTKVYLAVGGWGLGASSTAIQSVAVNTGGARTKMANSLASLCQQYGFAGVDIEWASPITAAQFTTILTTVKTALGSKNVSASVSSDFWNLSGVNKVTTTLTQTVEFISLFTHKSAGSSLTYPHSAQNIQAVVERAQQVGMFPDLLLMPLPFYARTYALSSTGCTTAGCSVSGPGSTSGCIASGAIGQNTYPYYALESIIQDGNFDRGLYADDWIDDDQFYTSVLLTDGSIAQFDDPQGIIYKVGAAVDFCMGGISAFSIDQDNSDSALADAMWDLGALIPPADQIALNIGGNTLSPDGTVNDDYFAQATASLAQNYPWLSSVSMYRVLVFIALRAQQDLANRLRDYLQFSELSNDSFTLYQKWETKASDWSLANITGFGREYWTCSQTSNGEYQAGLCPYVFEQADNDLDLDKVYWKLVDEDNFADLVNSTLGLNISTLITGQIDVGRPWEQCVDTGGEGPKRRDITSWPGRKWTWRNLTYWDRTADEYADDGTGRIRHIITPKKYTTLDPRGDINPGPDPYDPDPNCKSTWFNVYQVNSTAMFHNPADMLNAWIQAHESLVTLMYGWGSSVDATDASLSSVLQSILTSLAVGNGSVQSTEQYIQEVRYDQDLQTEFDQYQARHSALQMFLDIGLTILGFIPGIGDLGLVADGFVRAVDAVSDAVRTARAAKTIEETTELSRALDAGVSTTEDAVSLGRELDGLLDSDQLESRGEFGSHFDQNNDVLLNCVQSGIDFLMDASDLGSAFFDDGSGGASSKRSWGSDISLLERESLFSRKSTSIYSRVEEEDADIDESDVGDDVSFDNSTLPHILAATPNATPCIWTMKSAGELKTSDYKKGCESSTEFMQWDQNAGTSNTGVNWIFTTYAQCKSDSALKANCQCDHILEALEVMQTLYPSWLKKKSLATRQALCAAFPDLTQRVMNALNDASNMEGLWAKPNVIKSNLVDPLRLTKVSAKSVVVKSADETQIAVDHMDRYAQNRAATAQAIDAVLNDEHSKVSNPPAEWTSLYDTDGDMMDTARAANDDGYKTKMNKAKVIVQNKNVTPGKRKAPSPCGSSKKPRLKP